jgi:hypothetical protein
LIALLRGLSDADWRGRPRAIVRVRDIAGHLLDGDLRKLSFGGTAIRADGLAAPEPSFADIVH